MWIEFWHLNQEPDFLEDEASMFHTWMPEGQRWEPGESRCHVTVFSVFFFLSQMRPPLPPAPPPKAACEAQYRPYLHVLPEDRDGVTVRGPSILPVPSNKQSA